MNTTLQIGLTAYYDGELYDEETGNLIPEALPYWNIN